MATRAKDTTTPGIVKDKRIISSSPSFPRPTNTARKSVNTTTTTTIPPNYIKPTKPSNADPSVKPVSTKASSTTLPKPDLARRRSFASKPLSQPKTPAPADKSPTSTGPVVRPKPRTERSRSSSSLKAPPTASPRSKVDTTTKKSVPVRSSRPATRPATTAVYRKKQPQSTAAAKTLISTISSAQHDVETDSCQDIHDQESIFSSVVDANNENDNPEMSPDMILDDLVEQTDEDAYLLSEASTVVSEIEQSVVELENKVNEVTEKLQQDNTKIEQSVAKLENRVNEVTQKLQQDNTKIEQSEAKLENKVNEVTESQQQDNRNNDESRSDADNANEANSDKDGVELEEEKVTCNETLGKKCVAAAGEEEKAVEENNEELGDKEQEVEKVSGGDEQVKSEKDDMKKKINTNTARWSNKKEPTAASNDVIEEAASKLRVQRKNKVLALVGAFETVMSSKHS
ncbi:hypothetical protein AgCh_025030 [Apium graveolens]